MTELLQRLKGVRRSGAGWTARCPAHDDRRNSLSVDHRDGRWLLKCHAGCDWRAVVEALDVDVTVLFDPDHGEEGGQYPSGACATAQPVVDDAANPMSSESQDNQGRRKPDLATPAELRLEQYAAAKALPLDFLRDSGLSELKYDGRPAVRMVYLGEGGEQLAVRFRIALDGDRFRWKSGAKPCLYGLNRLGRAREAGQVVLVEGESDCHTLWHHGIPALGVPGAANWREDRDAPRLDGIETIYVVVEPDCGGEVVKKWLSRSSIRHRVKLISLRVKDPSALHLDDPERFKARWQAACWSAVPWTVAEDEALAEQRSEAWEQSADLARAPDILEEFAVDLSQIGVVGEGRAAKLVYLALTSRLLDKPVSVVVKGPSSGGKSFIVESTLKFFPPPAFHALTAMSDRALAYSNEPLEHRHLVVYEAAGMESEFATYLIRSLLSEGRLRYETVEKTKEGLVPRLIEREGPTGLIVTTTRLSLHPENETRMLSLMITDTRDQTAAVFRVLAQEDTDDIADLCRWQALQTWLAAAPCQVTIPFAERLANLVPPVAVRLRRDFKTILMLVRAHALLHQASRRKDERGRVIAVVEDYAAVRELVADIVAQGVDATVKPEVREVVETVARLLEEERDEVRQVDLRGALPLDKSAISRRVAHAVDAGFLRNLEDRRGRPARLVLGDPLPDDLELLPTAERLVGEVEELRSCAVNQRDASLPPLSGSDRADGACTARTTPFA